MARLRPLGFLVIAAASFPIDFDHARLYYKEEVEGGTPPDYSDNFVNVPASAFQDGTGDHEGKKVIELAEIDWTNAAGVPQDAPVRFGVSYFDDFGHESDIRLLPAAIPFDGTPPEIPGEIEYLPEL